MTVVFISNYFNHHQKPFCDAMYRLIGEGYHFIETEPMEEERLNMGWGGDERKEYVKTAYLSAEERAECQQLVDNADVVILGSGPYGMLKKRLKEGKLTFKYSERKYKNGCPYIKLPKHFLINFKKYIRYKSFYLLCASAYTSLDFAKTFTFINRAYKWGYFPQAKKHEDIEALISAKNPNSLLWCARMVEVKHPEAAIELASKLKADGCNFKLKMIGDGPLKERIRQLISEKQLGNYVELLGAMTPEEVRKHMEESEVFLFTSGRGEGWGAVLNESMNSACAVVASHAIGSVPFLINNGENGFIYKDGDIDDMHSKVKNLLENSELRRAVSVKAYSTIDDEWNAGNAAAKFLEIAKRLLDGNKETFPYDDGVCSKAAILKDNWLR